MSAQGSEGLKKEFPGSNEGIVDAAELDALPDHAFDLNPARRPLIDDAALLAALEHRGIAGAALDTHYHYPMPPDQPLWKFPEVIMTSHISGSSRSPHYLRRVWEIFRHNLRRLADGQPLLNVLNSEQILRLDAE